VFLGASLNPVILKAAARYLGIRPTRLRADLNAGLTLRELARLHGATVGELRRAVLAVLAQQLDRALR
jgi:hypothetical protein